jgi:hypothetical protein
MMDMVGEGMWGGERFLEVVGVPPVVRGEVL